MGEWKYTTTVPGEQSVMIHLTRAIMPHGMSIFCVFPKKDIQYEERKLAPERACGFSFYCLKIIFVLLQLKFNSIEMNCV